jgi:glycosyltransferase involved in cell wall biosynthesis
MSPQGVPATSTTTRARPLVSGGPLRIAWLGRLNPAKGLHVLVQALALIPELQIRLDAYALREGDNGEYFRQLRQGLAQDPRIRLLPAVAPDEVNGTLANYDVVAVPSQGYETGPLVVLEAFASGIPVLGSALGGIAALVTDQETGLLVDPLRPDAWARAISDVYHDRTRLHRMMKNIVAPRTMADVARDMAALYRKTIMENSETQEMAPK